MCPCRFQVDPMELALCSESDLSATSRMNAYVKFLGFAPLKSWKSGRLRHLKFVKYLSSFRTLIELYGQGKTHVDLLKLGAWKMEMVFVQHVSFAPLLQFSLYFLRNLPIACYTRHACYLLNLLGIKVSLLDF